MTEIYTEDHRAKLEAYLAKHDLPQGLGSEESACTLAAINLAMGGELTDNIRDCMSEVLGGAAIGLQDAMPDEMRNSARYKALIPNMPGTGRDREAERLEVLMDWMWTVVLPQVQPIADKHGFGAEWRTMCETKTGAAARAARAAAWAAARADAEAAWAAEAARAAAWAAARAAEAAAEEAARAARAAAWAAAEAARAAAWAAAEAAAEAAEAAEAAAEEAVGGNFWTTVDPIGVLERMTYLGEQNV